MPNASELLAQIAETVHEMENEQVMLMKVLRDAREVLDEALSQVDQDTHCNTHARCTYMLARMDAVIAVITGYKLTTVTAPQNDNDARSCGEH